MLEESYERQNLLTLSDLETTFRFVLHRLFFGFFSQGRAVFFMPLPIGLLAFSSTIDSYDEMIRDQPTVVAVNTLCHKKPSLTKATTRAFSKLFGLVLKPITLWVEAVFESYFIHVLGQLLSRLLHFPTESASVTDFFPRLFEHARRDFCLESIEDTLVFPTCPQLCWHCKLQERGLYSI